MLENTLVPVDVAETALPTLLVEAAREYMGEARAERTRQSYKFAFRLFSTWCSAHGRCPLPASPETIAAWATALARGEDGGPPRARATVSLYVTAVVMAQRTAGYAFDRKNAVLAETLKGISRVKARTETVRKARPLMGSDLQELLKGLRECYPADARDGAMLSLGWAAALRRSELVSLDWQQIGEGLGYVRVDERGVEIILMRSKASQDAAVTIAIPVADVPSCQFWLERWAVRGNLQPGEPMFRAVDKAGRVASKRLTAGSVSQIVKSRLQALLRLRGKGKVEAEELARAFSGHSMRAGLATTCADADVPLSRLALHTRHKSLETLQGYVRSSEQWRKSPLKGLGF